jgi:hypothetical protein
VFRGWDVDRPDANSLTFHYATDSGIGQDRSHVVAPISIGRNGLHCRGQPGVWREKSRSLPNSGRGRDDPHTGAYRDSGSFHMWLKAVPEREAGGPRQEARRRRAEGSGPSEWLAMLSDAIDLVEGKARQASPDGAKRSDGDGRAGNRLAARWGPDRREPEVESPSYTPLFCIGAPKRPMIASGEIIIVRQPQRPPPQEGVRADR